MVCWLPTNTLIAFVYKDDVQLSGGHQFSESLHNWWQYEPHVWSWTYNVQFVLNIPLGGGGLLGKPIEQSLLNIPLCHLLPLPLFYCCRYLKWHLLERKAINAQAIPRYFVAWVDKSSHLCNFTTLELNILYIHCTLCSIVLVSFIVPQRFIQYIREWRGCQLNLQLTSLIPTPLTFKRNHMNY